MIYADEEYREGIEFLLENDNERYVDSEMGVSELIAYVIEHGEPEKRFGVLYHRIVHDVEYPVERKVFGRSLTVDEAKILAVHFIIKQEEENSLIEYGDPIVTEMLNYFAFEDGDVVRGYYKHIEAEE